MAGGDDGVEGVRPDDEDAFIALREEVNMRNQAEKKGESEKWMWKGMTQGKRRKGNEIKCKNRREEFKEK